MKAISGLVVIVFFVTVSRAQDSTSSVLTFKDAVNLGLKQNLNLNQQKNLLVSSRATRVNGFWSLLPVASISGNAGRNDGNSFIQQEGQVVNGVTDFVNASIDGSMPLIGGFNGLNTYRQSARLHDAQLHHVKRTSQDVIRDIARQYLTCLLDQQLVLINEKNLQLQEQQLTQISEQVALGSKAEVEQKLQEYQVKNANLLLLRSKNTLRNDLAILAQTLQIDPSVSFQVQEPGWTLATLDDLSLDTLYGIAEERRSDLERAKLNERASELGYQAQKGNYFPSISLFASYGSAYNYVYRNEIFNPTNRTFSQQFTKDNTQFTYGLSLQVPLHGAFRTRSAVVRNRVLYENAKLETENRELLVKSEVLLAYQNLKDAQATLEAANSQYEAAEVSYGLEKERYDLGISDIVALTQAAQSYTKAQGDLASARYTLLFQQLLVNYATGVLQAEDIP